MSNQDRPGRQPGGPVVGIPRDFGLKDGDGRRGDLGRVLLAARPSLDRLADPAADSRCGQRLHHRVQVAHGAGLDEAGRAVADHGQHRALGGDRFVLGRLGAEDRDHPAHELVRPAVLRRAAGEAACQRVARDVDVRVDEAGRHDETTPIQGAPGAHRARQRFSLADGDDPVSADRQSAVGDDLPAAVEGEDRGAGDEEVGLDRPIDRAVLRRHATGLVHAAALVGGRIRIVAINTRTVAPAHTRKTCSKPPSRSRTHPPNAGPSAAEVLSRHMIE